MSLENLFTKLEYSAAQMSLKSLQAYIASLGGKICSIYCGKRVESSNEAQERLWQGLLDQSSTITVPVFGCANEESLDIIKKVDNNAAIKIAHLVSGLPSVAENLNKKRMLLYTAEALATGRSLTELDKIETVKINKCIEEEINSLQSMLVDSSDGVARESVIQIFCDKMDLFNLVRLIICSLSEGHLILTCHIDNPRTLPMFILANILAEAASCVGNSISFLPITHQTLLPLIFECHCLIDDVEPPLFSKCNAVYYGSFSKRSKSCSVVFEDADIDQAAASILHSLIYCSGSSIMTSHVTLVQESVYNRFQDCLYDLVSKLTFDNPLNSNSTVSFMPSVKNAQNCLDVLNKVIEKDGATIIPSLNASKLTTSCIPPSIVSGVQCASDLFQKFPDGPYTCLIPFRTLKEAVLLANRLYIERSAAFLWTESVSLSMEAIDLFSYKIVSVNSMTVDFTNPKMSVFVSMTTEPSPSIDNEKSISTSTLESIAVSAYKAHILWNKRLDSERLATLQKAYLMSESLRLDSETNKMMKMLSASNKSNTHAQKGIRTISVDKSKGCLLLILEGTITNLNLLLKMIVSSLFIGNSMVILCSCESVKNTLLQWITVYEQCGVDKHVLSVMFGEIGLTWKECAVRIKDFSSVICFGQPKSIGVISDCVWSEVFILPPFDDNSDEFINSIIRSQKTIIFSAGHNFAN